MFLQITEVMLFMLAVIGWFYSDYKYKMEREKRFGAYHRGYIRGREDYIRTAKKCGGEAVPKWNSDSEIRGSEL